MIYNFVIPKASFLWHKINGYLSFKSFYLNIWYCVLCYITIFLYFLYYLLLNLKFLEWYLLSLFEHKLQVLYNTVKWVTNMQLSFWEPYSSGLVNVIKYCKNQNFCFHCIWRIWLIDLKREKKCDKIDLITVLLCRV